MCFHWKSLLRQIRIVGELNNVPDKDADAYYSSRSYGSRIGAWASNQSQKIQRIDLSWNQKLNFTNNNLKIKIVSRPPHWGGYCLSPISLEFWQGRSSRLHDRIVYTKDDNQWTKIRLSP